MSTRLRSRFLHDHLHRIQDAARSLFAFRLLPRTLAKRLCSAQTNQVDSTGVKPEDRQDCGRAVACYHMVEPKSLQPIEVTSVHGLLDPPERIDLWAVLLV